LLSAASYPFSSGERPKATTFWGSNPRSIRLTLRRLFAKRPAPTRRAMERAI
jgi:hypothetical protein